MGNFAGSFEDNAMVALEMLVETIHLVRMRPSILPYSGMNGKHQAFVLSMTPAEAEHRHQIMQAKHVRPWRERTEVVLRRPRVLNCTRAWWDRCQKNLFECSANIVLPFVLLTCCQWIVVCALSFGFAIFRTSIQSAGIALFLVVAGLSIAVHQLLSCNGTSFPGVVLVLIGLQESLLWSTTQEIKENHQVPLMQPASNVSSDWGLPSSWQTEVLPYPVCRMNWGSHDAELTVMDMVSLAWVAYEKDCDRIPALLTKAFAGTGKEPTLEFCNPINSLPRSVVVYFKGMEGKNGTRVVSVKGTTSKTDIYADISLYGSVQLLQWFSQAVVPLNSLLPVSIIEHMIRVQHVGSYFWPPDRLIENISNMSYFLGLPPGKVPPSTAPAVLTGHSLGGGLAAVASGRLGLDSLVFSAPGNVYTSRVFQLPQQRTQKYVNIMPDNDVVPRVDQHQGVIQHILCRDTDGHEESAATCHALAKTACELWRLCGDSPYNRNFTGVCSKYVNRKTLGKEYSEHHDQWMPPQ